MYEEHDALAEVLAQAREDLGENAKGLPDDPHRLGHQASAGRSYAFCMVATDHCCAAASSIARRGRLAGWGGLTNDEQFDFTGVDVSWTTLL
jgi:hypothetical protein